MADEQTVLGIANETRRILNTLEATMDRALRRGTSKEAESGIREQNPSVIGEIIDLMHENNKKLADLSEQIRLEVIVKLDRLDKPDTGQR